MSDSSAPSGTRRAILLGGTFDPIHRGHLAVAAQVRELLAADEVWLIPAGEPPHRGATAAAAADREAMVAAAAGGQPHLRVLDLELRRPGPSYTWDTVVELAAGQPDVEQWLLLGADAAREIGSWHRLGDLLREARFVIVNREGVGHLTAADAEALGFDPLRTRVVEVASPPVSATEVRRRAAAGEPLDELVPAGVAALILERGLYGASPAGRAPAVPDGSAGPLLDNARRMTQDRAPENLAALIATAMEDKKAREVVVLDIRGKTTVADFMVVGEGDTDRQIRAIAENVEDKLRDLGIRPLHASGKKDASWACLDYDSVIAHVLLPGERSYYDLEGLWGRVPRAAEAGSD